MKKDAARDLLIQEGLYPEVTAKSAVDAFLSACKDGHAEVVKAYLALGINPNVMDPLWEETPLIRATEDGRIEVMAFLLEAGADIDRRDFRGETALRTAINWGQKQAAELLLKKGAATEVVCGQDETPLQKAISTSRTDLIDLLLEYQADPNYQGERFLSAMRLAVRNQDLGLLAKMRKAGGDIEERSLASDDTLLLDATKRSLYKTMEWLLKQGADPQAKNRWGWNAPMCGEFFGTSAYFKGFDVGDAAKRRAFFRASRQGEIEQLKALHAEGLSWDIVDPFGKTALMVAADSGQADVVEFFLSLPNPLFLHSRDEDGHNALWFAVKANQAKIAKRLVDAGVDPNPVPPHTKENDHLLSSVVLQRSYAMLRALKGARWDIKEASYLHSSLIYGDKDPAFLRELLELLKEGGSDLVLRDTFDKPLLHGLVSTLKIPFVREAQDAGMDIHLLDKYKQGVLDDLCCFKQELDAAEMVRFLLKRGANPFLANRYGSTPFVGARTFGNQKCSDALKEWLCEAIDSAKRLSGWDETDIFQTKEARISYAKTFLEYLGLPANASLLNECLLLDELDLFQGLVEMGVSPNPIGELGDTPLGLAAKKKDLGSVLLLLEYGADPNRMGEYSSAPFFIACQHGGMEILLAMLEAGADPCLCDTYLSTPLHSAASGNQIDVMTHLVSLGAKIDPHPSSSSPLISAVYQGAKEAMVWLIEQGASLNTRNFKRQNALHIAATYGREEIALLLIEAGIETDVVDKEGNTPLAYAQQRGMSSVIRALGGEEKTPPTPTGGVMAKKKKQKATKASSSTTSQGGDEKRGGSSAVKDAQAFLKKKKRPQDVHASQAITAFLNACRWGEMEVVKAYLTLGMNPNAAEPMGSGYGGETALIRTIEGDQRDIALMLMEAGADLEQRDGWGDTALRTAVNWQRWGILEDLLKRGAQPNTINAQKTSALGWAKQRGFKKAIELLEAYGAVDETKKKESTVKKPAQKAVKKMAIKKTEAVSWSSPTAEVLPSQPIQQITDVSALSGLRVYLGGLFKGQEGKRLQALLVARGATVTRRFTKNLQLCVLGNYTKRKKQQASQWLLPVWEEEHAKKMLGF